MLQPVAALMQHPTLSQLYVYVLPALAVIISDQCWCGRGATKWQ